MIQNPFHAGISHIQTGHVIKATNATRYRIGRGRMISISDEPLFSFSSSVSSAQTLHGSTSFQTVQSGRRRLIPTDRKTCPA